MLNNHHNVYVLQILDFEMYTLSSLIFLSLIENVSPRTCNIVIKCYLKWIELYSIPSYLLCVLTIHLHSMLAKFKCQGPFFFFLGLETAVYSR
jgi:hypothetical protein